MSVSRMLITYVKLQRGHYHSCYENLKPLDDHAKSNAAAAWVSNLISNITLVIFCVHLRLHDRSDAFSLVPRSGALLDTFYRRFLPSSPKASLGNTRARLFEKAAIIIAGGHPCACQLVLPPCLPHWRILILKRNGCHQHKASARSASGDLTRRSLPVRHEDELLLVFNGLII